LKIIINILVYPLSIRILKIECVISTSNPEFEHDMSRKASVKQLRDEIAKKFFFAPHKIKLWFENRVKQYRVLKLEEILEDVFIDRGMLS
jgi:hypothetical protein